MPFITLISEHNTKKIECALNAKLSDVLCLHKAEIDFPCVGRGKCRQCRVKISTDESIRDETAGGQPHVNEPSPEEKAALTSSELASGTRLACLVRVTGDICVELCKKPEVEQIAGCGLLSEFNLKPQYTGFAAAVDIGTTTLAASLCADDSVLPVKTAVLKNPQTFYGADVISRIGLSLAGKGEELASCVIGGINSLLADLRSDGDFSRLTVTGNTAMLYLLTRQNPDCLSHAPFTLDRTFGETIAAKKLGLYAPPETPVFLPHCLSSFVGADITAAITASRLCFQRKPSLLVDIGTNGEMALFTPKTAQKPARLLVCSTAAGPAFEGEGIVHGKRGIAGAIDSVTLAGNTIVCGTIGGFPACGICGSGIIDAIAVLKQTGLIDETGSIQEDGHDFEQLVCEYCGQTAVKIEKNVVLTQKDIRNVQLAKSAVCAGLQTLISESGLSGDDIETVFVAGGFGSYLNLQNAGLIGLIPAKLCAKTQVLGNASLSGAVMMTQNADFIEESRTYAEFAQTVDLAANKTFMDLYVENMFF